MIKVIEEFKDVRCLDLVSYQYSWYKVRIVQPNSEGGGVYIQKRGLQYVPWDRLDKCIGIGPRGIEIPVESMFTDTELLEWISNYKANICHYKTGVMLEIGNYQITRKTLRECVKQAIIDNAK